MKKSSFSGSAEITDSGIKKHFKNYEPIKVLFELVWNSFDANSQRVDISIQRNIVTGLEYISILDNGDGIDIENIKDNFGKFNESKKNDKNKHGSNGRGRLAFHRLCNRATWFTRRHAYDAKIIIDSFSIKKFHGEYIQDVNQNPKLKKYKKGTCVLLSNFDGVNLPEDERLINELGIEFGWLLAIDKRREIILNDIKITIPKHEIHEKDSVIDGINFEVKVIRWESKPGSEKSFNYLVNHGSKIVYKELSKFNKKIRFYSSAFIYSPWIDEINIDDIYLRYSEKYNIYQKLNKYVTRYQRKIYLDFLRSHIEEEIHRYEEHGYFPNYQGLDSTYANWRKENTKKIVKEIYFADPSIFSKLKAKQTKILIRLLDKIIVSNENDSFYEVLEGIIDLDSDSMESFSKQLKISNLNNIIATIETLQKRQFAISELREIMNNRFSEVLETPDLQKIIENNTWLFGPQYETLGAEEDDFQKIALNLREEVKDIHLIKPEDIEEAVSLPGVRRQVDLFLARKKPTYDSRREKYYRCVVVEIKRPGISLNKRHLQQIDDYAEIISAHPAFKSEKMRFEIILIGRKISKDDYHIQSRLDSLKDKCDYGLVTDGIIKCYVKDWFTIFDEFELSNLYLLETLNSKVQDLSASSTTEIIEDLQN